MKIAQAKLVDYKTQNEIKELLQFRTKQCKGRILSIFSEKCKVQPQVTKWKIFVGQNNTNFYVQHNNNSQT